MKFHIKHGLFILALVILSVSVAAIPTGYSPLKYNPSTFVGSFKQVGGIWSTSATGMANTVPVWYTEVEKAAPSGPSGEGKEPSNPSETKERVLQPIILDTFRTESGKAIPTDRLPAENSNPSNPSKMNDLVPLNFPIHARGKATSNPSETGGTRSSAANTCGLPNYCALEGQPGGKCTFWYQPPGQMGYTQLWWNGWEVKNPTQEDLAGATPCGSPIMSARAVGIIYCPKSTTVYSSSTTTYESK